MATLPFNTTVSMLTETPNFRLRPDIPNPFLSRSSKRQTQDPEKWEEAHAPALQAKFQSRSLGYKVLKGSDGQVITKAGYGNHGTFDTCYRRLEIMEESDYDRKNNDDQESMHDAEEEEDDEQEKVKQPQRTNTNWPWKQLRKHTHPTTTPNPQKEKDGAEEDIPKLRTSHWTWPVVKMKVTSFAQKARKDVS